MAIKRLDIERSAGKLSINYRWRSKVAYFMVPFCLFWDGSVLVFLLNGAGWMILLHLLAGALITYYTLCLLFNRTLITVDSRAITVDHGPVPWISATHQIDSGEVKQLFVQQSGQYKSGNKVTLLYQVVVRPHAGKDLSLLSGLDDPDLAAQLESSIEDFLDIRDEPVSQGFEAIALPAPLQRWIDKQMPPAGPRAEPGRVNAHAPHPTYDFALCHARVGQRFSVEGKPSELRSARTIEWTDGQEESARTLRVAAVDGAEDWQFYACQILDRWQYFEERSLAGEERERLGFVGEDAAGSFRNGEDRYYAHPPQSGRRGGEEVTQWIYTSSGATTRFRCLRGPGNRWEVYVQEPFDSGYIEAVA